MQRNVSSTSPDHCGQSSGQTSVKLVSYDDYERLFFGKQQKPNLDVKGNQPMKVMKQVSRRSVRQSCKGVAKGKQSGYVRTTKDGVAVVRSASVAAEFTSTAAQPGGDLLSKFYAKLQEIEDSNGYVDETHDIDPQDKLKSDRRHITTAVRRLLTERLWSGHLLIDKSYQTSSEMSNGCLGMDCCMAKGPINISDQYADGGQLDSKIAFHLRNIDDLNLRKYLEELYRDYQFMGRLINTTTGSDNTEMDVCHRLGSGCEYLLQRALFWLERSTAEDEDAKKQLSASIQKLLEGLSSHAGAAIQGNKSHH
ncbi:hypothetical protein Btru_075193 [Bulinus truncatus]|nr:hypothetical protein Btru_075193 [Bulinus truncatus]